MVDAHLVGEAYSYNTGERMVRYSEEQITELILKDYAGKRIVILAPSVMALAAPDRWG